MEHAVVDTPPLPPGVRGRWESQTAYTCEYEKRPYGFKRHFSRAFIVWRLVEDDDPEPPSTLVDAYCAMAQRHAAVDAASTAATRGAGARSPPPSQPPGGGRAGST